MKPWGRQSGPHFSTLPRQAMLQAISYALQVPHHGVFITEQKPYIKEIAPVKNTLGEVAAHQGRVPRPDNSTPPQAVPQRSHSDTRMSHWTWRRGPNDWKQNMLATFVLPLWHMWQCWRTTSGEKQTWWHTCSAQIQRSYSPSSCTRRKRNKLQNERRKPRGNFNLAKSTSQEGIRKPGDSEGDGASWDPCLHSK